MQVIVNDDNLADIQAEYTGPGTNLMAVHAATLQAVSVLHLHISIVHHIAHSNRLQFVLQSVFHLHLKSCH